MKSIILLLFSGVAHAFAEDTNQIVFSRPSKVGDSFLQSGKIVAHWRVNKYTESAIETAFQNVTEIRYSARITVEKIDGAGWPTKKSCEIIKFDGSVDGIEFRPVSIGDKITAENSEQDVAEIKYLVNGDPRKDTGREFFVLPEIMQLDPVEEPTKDQLYGVVDRKKVGEKWSVNTRAVAQATKLYKGLKPKDVWGEVELQKPAKYSEIDCLQIMVKVKHSPSEGEVPLLEKGRKQVFYTYEFDALEAVPINISNPLRPYYSASVFVRSVTAPKNGDLSERVAAELEVKHERKQYSVK